MQLCTYLLLEMYTVTLYKAWPQSDISYFNQYLTLPLPLFTTKFLFAMHSYWCNYVLVPFLMCTYNNTFNTSKYK